MVQIIEVNKNLALLNLYNNKINIPHINHLISSEFM